MCGRYYIDEETAIELEKIVKNIDKKLNPLNYVKDIVPSVKAPVLTSSNEEMSVELFTWGFQNYDKKKLIINARAETVSVKRMFKDCLYTRRCIIPAKGFYEWDQSKNKFTFTNQTNKFMHMAGLYNEEGRFVIITTKANESMEPIHDRMPLILSQELVKIWLQDNSEIEFILNQIPPVLKRNADMEQMTFKFF